MFPVLHGLLQLQGLQLFLRNRWVLCNTRLLVVGRLLICGFLHRLLLLLCNTRLLVVGRLLIRGFLHRLLLLLCNTRLLVVGWLLIRGFLHRLLLLLEPSQ